MSFGQVYVFRGVEEEATEGWRDGWMAVFETHSGRREGRRDGEREGGRDGGRTYQWLAMTRAQPWRPMRVGWTQSKLSMPGLEFSFGCLGRSHKGVSHNMNDDRKQGVRRVVEEMVGRWMDKRAGKGRKGRRKGG
jgi:hypothetical protein